MTAYIVRRLVLLVITWFGVTLIAFFLTHFVPADPVLAMVGDSAPPSVVATMRHRWGLDQPVPIQYLKYMSGLIHGNLGVSLRTRRPVIDDLKQYFPATIELAVAAMIFTLVIGLPLGVLAAVNRNRWPDAMSRILSISGVSLPVFWLGLILLAIFYYHLHWFPGPGELDPRLIPPPRRTGFLLVDALLAHQGHIFWNAVGHLVLPAVTLGLQAIAIVTRMVRSSMLEILPADFVRTARAKGLKESSVVWRHALRNALVPTLTVIGVVFASLLSGAVLTETIFSWPGIGRYATNAVVSIDIPAVTGVTLLAAVTYSILNFIVDLLYGVLDPRIRFQ